MEDELLSKLEQRLWRIQARQRLGIETDHEAQVFAQSLNFFHIENWYSVHSLIRNILKLSGLYWRGRRNAERVTLKHNSIECADLPASFDGFTILHISDTHVDMSQRAMRRLVELVSGLSYDLCVLTGDYRGKTFGAFDAALEGMARVTANLKQPILGVLGNHDTIRMLPGLEAMGIRMLQNECRTIARGGQKIFVAGIDDAHYFRVDNIEKVGSEIPDCQSACKFDPSSASNFDPFARRVLPVALVSSELAGIAEARRARVA